MRSRGEAGRPPVASRAEAGFTLIEVLVALAILSIAVVACIEGFAQGLRLLRVAGDHQRAILLADEKAREVVDIRESQEQGTEGPYHWERTLSPIVAPDLVPATGQPLWRLYQIAVRVGWERRVVEVRTLRMVAISSITTVTGTTGTPGTGTASSAQSNTGLSSLLGGSGSSSSSSSSSAINSLLGGGNRR